jgi:hypothetical protein
MKTVAYTICILLLAGYISDGDGLSYFAAAIGIALAVWALPISGRAKETRFLILDPDTLNPEPLKGALISILDDVRRTQQPIRLRLAPLTRHLRFRPQLQLNRQGDMEIAGCSAKGALEQPNVWIADHPLPLPLATAHCSVLTFTPSRGNRVRVGMNEPALFAKRELMMLGGLLAITALLGYHALFSAILAFTLQGALVNNVKC